MCGGGPCSFFLGRAHASWGLGTIFFRSPTRPFALGKRTSRYPLHQFKYSPVSPPSQRLVLSNIPTRHHAVLCAKKKELAIEASPLLADVRISFRSRASISTASERLALKLYQPTPWRCPRGFRRLPTRHPIPRSIPEIAAPRPPKPHKPACRKAPCASCSTPKQARA